MLPNDSD